MSDLDAIAGMYNVVVRDERETADYQVPIEEFLRRLENRDLPDKLCVVGLDTVLSGEADCRERLVSTMRREIDYLNAQRPLPTIQFAVSDTLQSVGTSFDLEVDGEFYSLQPVFGRQMKQREPGWLVTPFRV
jgi:hypothetical protein